MWKQFMCTITMAVQQCMYLSKNKALRTIGGNCTNTKTELELPVKTWEHLWSPLLC